MAGFSGRWRLVKQENLLAYHNQIHTPEEYKTKLHDLLANLKNDPESYVEVLNIDPAAGFVHRTVFINGEKKRDSNIPIGVETDVTSVDGRTFKGKLDLVGDSKFVVHEKGADFEANLVFELKGNEILLTLTSGSVTAKQFYVRA